MSRCPIRIIMLDEFNDDILPLTRKLIGMEREYSQNSWVFHELEAHKKTSTNSLSVAETFKDLAGLDSPDEEVYTIRMNFISSLNDHFSSEVKKYSDEATTCENDLAELAESVKYYKLKLTSLLESMFSSESGLIYPSAINSDFLMEYLYIFCISVDSSYSIFSVMTPKAVDKYTHLIAESDFSDEMLDLMEMVKSNTKNSDELLKIFYNTIFHCDYVDLV